MRTYDADEADHAVLTPEKCVFILISFEGPDPYSQAGGLGVRVSGLARTLAELGFETHLFFLGDPTRPAQETTCGGRLTLHRWGQWISAYHPTGVYDGEEGKLRDLTSSLPPFAVERIVIPAIAAGRTPIVLSEEWQTADCAIQLSDHLHARGVRDQAVLLWNANNPYSFDRIDWHRLAFTNTITAVSRYMRSIIRARGVDALVIPNGIPRHLVTPVERRAVAAVRTSVQRAPAARLFFKMARWDRDKGWAQALDALLKLRERGRRATLVARSGGPSGSGSGLVSDVAQRGLAITELHDEGALHSRLGNLVRSDTDVVSLRFGVRESLARTLYAAADGVLANSVSEPFGLVGLEAMTAGGVVYTGGTGEDYAVSGRNAVVLETLDPNEIADRSDDLASHPEWSSRLRRAARATARTYTWDRVARLLIAAVEAQAARQAILPRVPVRRSVGSAALSDAA